MSLKTSALRDARTRVEKRFSARRKWTARVRYIKEGEAFQPAEKRQIGLQMVIESGNPGQARSM